MKLIRRICAVLLCVVLLVSAVPEAMAYGKIETGKPVSLTLNHRHAGVDFQIYRIASVSETAQFDLTGKFKAYANLQDELDAGEWDILIATLEAQIAMNDQIQPLKTGTTDAYGAVTFDDIPQGMYLVTGSAYKIGSVTNIPISFLISVPNLDESTDSWVYDVEATTKPPETPKDDKENVTVEKIWLKTDGISLPKSIKVQLLKNGKAYGKAITLSKENKWKYTWTNLEPAKWRVVEIDVPDGYQSVIERIGNKFTIINTYEKPFDVIPPTEIPPTKTPPTLPQTGQLWWPVPLLALAGMVCFLIGWAKRRRQENMQ